MVIYDVCVGVLMWFTLTQDCYEVVQKTTQVMIDRLRSILQVDVVGNLSLTYMCMYMYHSPCI